jgi:hypothetical protein
MLDYVAKRKTTTLIRDILAGRRGGKRFGRSLRGTLEDTGSSCTEIYR